MPNNRPGLGDDTERYIRHEHGYIEWRYAPGNTVEIVNIEVDGDHRGQGVGRLLLQRLFKVLTHDTKIYAITRADNEIAQRFYEATKFRVAGVLSRFYGVDRGVDAILYNRNAGGPV
jgi:ribosomal protein S18 acetylase RimI-like enzyme